MNRFKSNTYDPKAEDYSRRKQEVQLLTILDKCTQILRDDRIWLRNKVKQADPDITQIFKKYLSKRPADLSALQVNLRKHVMRIKDKSKKDQLQKFKQNLHNATSNTLFQKQLNGNYERNSRSTDMRKPANSKSTYFQDDQRDNYKNTTLLNNFKQESFRDTQNRRSNSNNRNTQFEGLKITDPICQDQEMEQMFSNRSKSEFTKAKLSQRGSERVEVKEGYQQLRRGWVKQMNHNSLVQQSKQLKPLELEIQQDGDYDEGYADFPEPVEYKQEVSPIPVPSSTYHKSIPLYLNERVYQIEESQVESNLINSQLNSHASSKIIQSQTYQYDTFAQSSKIESQFKSNNTLQAPSFSNTLAAMSTDKNNFLQPKQISVSKASNTYLASSNYQYVIEDQNKQLFTNQSLLEECKKFIQKSRSGSSSRISKSGASSNVKGDSLKESQVEISTFKNDKIFGELADKARDCNSQTKPDHFQNSVYQEKYSANPLPYLGTVEFSEREEIEPRLNLITDISKLYAEDVFDLIFPSTFYTLKSPPSITYPKYQQLVSQHFAQKGKFVKLFKLGDKSQNSTLFATDFGRLLLTNCNYKPSPNPVKEIFSLIDIDRKGYFTLDDYERFLEQVIDPEDESSNEVIEICERLFQMADVGKVERVEYWGLYLTRNTSEFKEFNVFLEQFEFEFEVAE